MRLLGGVTAFELLEPRSSSTLRHTVVLDGWIHQEWIILYGKAEIPREMRIVKHHRCVTFHLQEIIFIFPNKWNIFEFLYVVSRWRHHNLGRILLRICQQKVVDKLLSPLDDASNYMQRKHPKRVKNVDAFVQQLRMALLILA